MTRAGWRRALPVAAASPWVGAWRRRGERALAPKEMSARTGRGGASPRGATASRFKPPAALGGATGRQGRQPAEERGHWRQTQAGHGVVPLGPFSCREPVVPPYPTGRHWPSPRRLVSLPTHWQWQARSSWVTTVISPIRDPPCPLVLRRAARRARVQLQRLLPAVRSAALGLPADLAAV